jgi:hypothetical protein
MLEAVCQCAADDCHMVAGFEFRRGRLLGASERCATKRENKEIMSKFHVSVPKKGYGRLTAQ